MNRLVVPYGKRTTLQLADGTKVWVNSGTELEFPSKFIGKSREITVKGEIYIEVAKVTNLPFYVNTERYQVEVTGTTFNVSAYAENIGNAVVLVEGSVRVNTVTGNEIVRLVPNEAYVEGNPEILKTTVDISEYTSWKDGVFIFNKAPMAEVLKKVGRYYNIDFKDYSGSQLSSRTCTGKLLLSENFDEVMTAISALSSTQYIKENNTVYIKNP